MYKDIKRACHRCNERISVVQRLLAIYDWSIQCRKCGHLMETSITVLFANTLIAQFLAFLVVRSFLTERGLNFYLIVEVWAIFIFLPLISVFSFGLKRHYL